jgi:hypothetical protein
MSVSSDDSQASASLHALTKLAIKHTSILKHSRAGASRKRAVSFSSSKRVRSEDGSEEDALVEHSPRVNDEDSCNESCADNDIEQMHSCHQCQSTMRGSQLYFCRNRVAVPSGGYRYRHMRKYCLSCLSSYNINRSELNISIGPFNRKAAVLLPWDCPACDCIGNPAGCQCDGCRIEARKKPRPAQSSLSSHFTLGTPPRPKLNNHSRLSISSLSPVSPISRNDPSHSDMSSMAQTPVVCAQA